MMTILKELLQVEPAPPRDPADVAAEMLAEILDITEVDCEFAGLCRKRHGTSPDYLCNWVRLPMMGGPSQCGLRKQYLRGWRPRVPWWEEDEEDGNGNGHK